MTELKDIETLARDYADHYQQLAADVEVLETAIRTIKKKMLPSIKRAAGRAAAAKEQLKAAIEAAPQLFEKPRTRLFHGIKVGITKKKGRVEWDDEAKVIERIEKQLPKDQIELLIRVDKHVHKPGVYDLTVADLKRLGITIVGDGDETVVKVADSDIEKMVDALLDDDADVAKVAA